MDILTSAVTLNATLVHEFDHKSAAFCFSITKIYCNDHESRKIPKIKMTFCRFCHLGGDSIYPML